VTAPSMVLASDLNGFPGGPFSQEMVDVAVAAIRSEVGWHIAPVVTETLSLWSNGSHNLLLPSLRVVSVQSVVAAGVAVTAFQVAPGCLLQRFGYYPAGLGSWYQPPLLRWPVGPVDVTLTHGFDSAQDLIPAIAARLFALTRDRSVQVQTDGPFSTTYRADVETDGGDPAVSRYRIPVVA
jgi:hypothetical protein